MFTTDIASDLQQALGADQDFAHYARYFDSTVLLVSSNGSGIGLHGASGAGRMLITVDGGAAVCDAPTEVTDAAITLTAPAEAWARLASPTEVNATLTRMLREGDLTIDGDVARAMHQWRPLFWIVALLRQALSGVTEF